MSLFTGFVTVRKFKEFALPVPIQNKLLRDYASEKGMRYKLPNSEIVLEDNFMMMFETAKSIERNGNLGMCSIHMFPSNLEKLKKIVKLLKRKNITLHFIFENKVIHSEEIIDFYLMNNLDELIKFYDKEDFKDFI